MEKLTILIPERMLGLRLDVALSEMLPDYSRSKITAWIKSGEALIGQKTFKPKDKSKAEEYKKALDVLHADDDTQKTFTIVEVADDNK